MSLSSGPSSWSHLQSALLQSDQYRVQGLPIGTYKITQSGVDGNSGETKQLCGLPREYVRFSRCEVKSTLTWFVNQ